MGSAVSPDLANLSIRWDIFQYIESIHITYTRLEIVRGIVEYARLNRGKYAKGFLTLLGPVGVGKSILFDSVVSANPCSVTPTTILRPIFKFVVPAVAGIIDVASAILDALADPLAYIGNEASRKKRVEGYLIDCAVEQILVDESQHFLDSKHPDNFTPALSWLIDICSEAGISCVFTGLKKSMEKSVFSNGQLLELRETPIILDPFSWLESEPETIEEFLAFLQGFSAEIPIEGGLLQSEEIAWDLYISTNGVMRRLMLLLREATWIAVERGGDCLEIKDLEAAHENLAHKLVKTPNPFSVEYSKDV
jgi:hypothetical protein